MNMASATVALIAVMSVVVIGGRTVIAVMMA
jgi:hypothetical protein